MSAVDRQRATGAVPTETEASVKQAALRGRRRRRLWLWIARLGFAVFVIGGWQLFTARNWVDPFFYGQPSLIWKSLVRPVHQGHRVRLHLGRHRRPP